MMGIVLALAGLVLVLDVLGGVRLSLVGVAWGGIAALGLAAYFLLSGRLHKESLPPLGLAGGGLAVGALALAALAAAGLLPAGFAGAHVLLLGATVPWWVPVVLLAVVAGAVAYVTGIAAARRLGAKLASFVGLAEVLFAVLFAWVLLGELPGPAQLLGGVLILAGVVVVRSEERATCARASEPEPAPALGATSLGDQSVVVDHGVEPGGVDVASAQLHRAAVGAVEHH
jgi:drug/metabolite transporter (DMT)-like permease